MGVMADATSSAAADADADFSPFVVVASFFLDVSDFLLLEIALKATPSKG